MAIGKQADEQWYRSRGVDALLGLVKRVLKAFDPHVVFDVGANVGRFALTTRDHFPDCEIFAFEPVSSTYASLEGNVAGFPGIHPVQLALGDADGIATVTSVPNALMNRLVAGGDTAQPHESVRVERGDTFCAARGIAAIDYLKIDTEGEDLNVIRGFQELLSGQRIGLVEAEVSMTSLNRRHVPFEAVKALLEPLGYHLFHIYEQQLDIPFSGRPYLRRCNVVFISDAVVRSNVRRGAAR